MSPTGVACHHSSTSSTSGVQHFLITSFPPSVPSGSVRKVQLLRVGLSEKGEVLQATVERNQVYGRREREMRHLLQVPRTPNLVDAFGVVGKAGSHNHWRFFVRMLTIMPTAFACEQSFSFFKTTIHSNMSEEKAVFSEWKNGTIRKEL